MTKPLLAAGTYTADVILAGIDRLAKPGEVIYLDEPFELRAGGHAVNVAIDAARLGYRGRVYSVGAVGDDGFGEFLVSSVRRGGAEPRVEVVDAPTARNLIIALRGEDRRFHVYRGANRRLSPVHVRRVLLEVGPERLYMALGFSPALDVEAPEILREARRAGASLIMIDPAYTERRSVEALKPVLSLADVIHLNEEELKMLTGAAGVEEGLKALSRATKAIIAVTGSWGVAAALKGFIVRQPSFKVNVIDPTGAGDAFCAGLLVSLEPGAGLEDLPEALARAQAAAAAAVSSVGATEGVEMRRVEAILREGLERVLEGTRVYRV